MRKTDIGLVNLFIERRDKAFVRQGVPCLYVSNQKALDKAVPCLYVRNKMSLDKAMPCLYVSKQNALDKAMPCLYELNVNK